MKFQDLDWTGGMAYYIGIKKDWTGVSTFFRSALNLFGTYMFVDGSSFENLRRGFYVPEDGEYFKDFRKRVRKLNKTSLLDRLGNMFEEKDVKCIFDCVDNEKNMLSLYSYVKEHQGGLGIYCKGSYVNLAKRVFDELKGLETFQGSKKCFEIKEL